MSEVLDGLRRLGEGSMKLRHVSAPHQDFHPPTSGARLPAQVLGHDSLYVRS